MQKLIEIDLIQILPQILMKIAQYVIVLSNKDKKLRKLLVCINFTHTVLINGSNISLHVQFVCAILNFSFDNFLYLLLF
jgi:hypothetical protein